MRKLIAITLGVLLMSPLNIGCRKTIVTPSPSPSIIAAPSGLTYGSNPASYTENVAISANSPSITGSVDTYSVAPPLPTGLSLHATTGVISGTPSVSAASTVYVITATNAGGSTTCDLTLAVAVEFIVWDALVNTAAVGGTLTKNAGGTAWNAGGFSSQAIASGVAGYVEYTAVAATRDIVFGLSDTNPDANFTGIDFGLYMYSSQGDDGAGVSVQEGGVQRTINGGGYPGGYVNGSYTNPIAPGDVLRVNKTAGGLVTYLINGVVFYTSGVTASAVDYFADVSINRQSDAVGSARIKN